MKKSILLFASICAKAFTSCKKDDPATTATTTATPVNPYTEIGLDQIGGNYSGSALFYQDLSNSNALVIKDFDYSVDVSYSQDSIHIVVNTSMNIPSSLKDFYIKTSVFLPIENIVSETNQSGLYSGFESVGYNFHQRTIGISLSKLNSNYVEAYIGTFIYENDLGKITLENSGGFYINNVKRNY